MSRCVHVRLCLTIGLALSSSAFADDWPTFMHDNARSGVTAERLTPPLAEQWVYRAAQRPQPAWPERVVYPERVGFDRAYHVVAATGRVYFGSSSQDQVTCLDAATGGERWRTLVGGPVRLAPTLWQDRVLAGSEDGRVYCLDRDDGRVRWTFRGAPSDRRVLGMGRMISTWPVRTGVLAADGIAYFAAGLFPTEGVYLYALRADTGRVVWTNDTVGQLYVRLPHGGSEGFSGISPQGPMLAGADRIYVPNGRNVPAAFDRKTGKLLFWRAWTHRHGGVWALLTGDLLLSGGTNRFFAIDKQTGRDRFACFPGQRIVVTPAISYLLVGSSLTAVDRKAYPALSTKEMHLNRQRLGLVRWPRRYRRQIRDLRKKHKKATGSAPKEPSARERELQKKIDGMAKKLSLVNAELKPVRQAIKDCIKWQSPCKGAHALILAGGVLYAGGPDEVTGIDAATGKVLWTGRVEGNAYGLAVADGHLYVSTDSGRIHCFAATGGTAKEAIAPKPVASPYPTDRLAPVYAEAADRIVKETGITKGYCLVLGCGRGRLAYELAKRTELDIVGIEDNADRVDAARKALDAAGLYGVRVAVVQGRPDRLPFASYFANLIVSDRTLISGQPGAPAEEIRRVLKPLGGVAYLGQSVRVNPGAKPWTRLTREPPKGAGQWTHQYGDAGNSGCSTDRAVQAPFRVLWFGRPGPGKMMNRHFRGSAPVSTNGRLFIQGEHRIMAVDAYNGRMLWEHKIQGARRGALGAQCSNLAATDSCVFLAVGAECFQFDAATGAKQATYKTPPAPDGKPRQWGYVAWQGDLLFGSTMAKRYRSNALFAIDRRTGKVRWVDRRKAIPNAAIAVGHGRVFLVDRRLPEAPTATSAELVALDATDGKPCWHRPFDAKPFLTSSQGQAIRGLTLSYVDGRVFVANAFGGKRLMAVNAADGVTVWDIKCDYQRRHVVVGRTLYANPFMASGSAAYDVRTGRRITRAHPVSGKPVPWQMARAYGCGTISASPNCLFFRSGAVGYYDLKRDGGTSNWGGMRPGCWINVIAAAGLVLIPEGSAYCTCSYPIQTTLALEPVERHEHWAVFSTAGPTTPVRHLAVNLGAPGDRRADDGTMWFAHPRPSSRFAMKFRLDVRVQDGLGFFGRNAENVTIRGTDKPWLFASGCRGLTRCAVPLIEKGAKPATYTVKLGFAELDPVKPGQRVFDIKLQGRPVAKAFDVVHEAGGRNVAVVKTFAGVRVADTLVVEFLPKTKRPSAAQAAQLNCIEVVREEP